MRWLGPWWLWVFAAFFIVGAAGYLSMIPECASCQSVSSR